MPGLHVYLNENWAQYEQIKQPGNLPGMYKKEIWNIFIDPWQRSAYYLHSLLPDVIFSALVNMLSTRHTEEYAEGMGREGISKAKLEMAENMRSSNKNNGQLCP